MTGSNLPLAAPGNRGFDLAAGTITAQICAGCVMEIYSANGGQGAIFEGQSKADERPRRRP
jgi:hypothetical protein